MAPPERETDARILIDSLLRDAGRDPADKSQVRTEVLAIDTGSKTGPSIIQEDGAVYSSGRCDYVLADSNSRPLAVIEAKRGSIDPYTA